MMRKKVYSNILPHFKATPCLARRDILPWQGALLHQKSYQTVRSTGSQEILVAFPAGELARVIVRGSLLLATAP